MQLKLKVVEVPVDKLIPYAGNAKEHPDWQVEQIAESISQFGNCDPIGAWHNPEGGIEIVEGHGRLLALKSLGIEKAPVIFLDHLTDEDRRAYALIHNQTTMNSGFDLETLQKELEAITTIDMSRFDFEISEFDGEEELEEVKAEEDELPDASPCRVKPGDIWQLGDHKLVCGDSTDSAVLDALLCSPVDLLLTDPPYGVSYVGKTEDALTIDNDGMSGEEYVQFLTNAMQAAKDTMKDGAAFYVWFATRMTAEAYEAMQRVGLEVRQEIYWIKSNITLGRQDYQWQTEPCLYGWKDGTHWFAPTRREHNIFDDMADIRKMDKVQLLELIDSLLFKGEETDAIREDKPMRNGEHPTMKPVGLFARLIRNSTQKGDTVLDVFAGSGTTAIACEQMGRKAMMVELSEGYCDVIIERWENFTGEKAKKVGEIG